MKGGMDLYGRHLLQGLAQRGHHVTVITTRHPDGRSYEDADGIRIHYLQTTTFGSPWKGWKRESARGFAGLLRQGRMDLVLSQQTAACGVVRLARKSGIPIVSIMHGYETMVFLSELTASLNFRQGWYSLLKSLLSTLYCTIAQEIPILWSSTRIIAVSRSVHRALRLRLAFRDHKIRVVHHGIDTNRFSWDPVAKAAMRQKLGINAGEQLVLFLSLITRQKGADIAIRAVKELESRQGLRLIIAGDGEYLEEAQVLASKLGVANRVIFTGYVPNERTNEYYGAADIFIFPTLRRESFGIVAAEAMACGLPVIASNIGSIPEVIDNGMTGILVTPGSCKELGERIALLLDNADLRERLGTKARQKAQRDFSQRRMMEDTLAVLFEALSSPLIY